MLWVGKTVIVVVLTISFNGATFSKHVAKMHLCSIVALLPFRLNASRVLAEFRVKRGEFGEKKLFNKNQLTK